MDPDYFAAPRQIINTAFEEILSKRLDRRAFVRTSLSIGTCGFLSKTAGASSLNAERTIFKEIPHGLDENLHLAKNYTAQVLLRWGDALFSAEQNFDPFQQSAAKQNQQFGYNNDFVAYMPFSDQDDLSSHGLLVVNHEFVSSRLMHPGSPHPRALSQAQINTEMAAHGMSIVEVQKNKKYWKVNYQSLFNRRITPHTNMKFSGPARGHVRLKTKFSIKGEKSLGTFGNCAGGLTPWGTVLTAEENIQAYFIGSAKQTDEFNNYKRFGLLGDQTAFSIWGKYHAHWNLDSHPHAALHAGWIVEVDPFDNKFVPIKRTALGRCKHEGCGVHINKDGRVVLYMGDDQVFEYVYRFVSKQRFKKNNRKHNMTLLDHGELSVAEFSDQGKVIWHPLQFGTGPHTQEHGFNSQADVVLDMRKAADLVGATPMDRPEEIKVNPQSGNVFAVFTNNFKRAKKDAANPRIFNQHGHILELIPPDQDHSAHEYQWDIYILAGDINNKLDQTYYNKDVSNSGWFSNPDNCSFDTQGNIWIATDGFNRSGFADGIWISATEGKQKALPRHFLRAPIGAEICSPCFTPNQKTMFCSVQHPGAGSSFDQPSTRWPDLDASMPPRPSVIAVQRDDGKTLLS